VWNLYSGKDDRRPSKLVTTNPVYRCEELEDAMSVYDDINEQCQYDDLNERTMKHFYTSCGGVAQWYDVGLWPANFPCPALDLQLMGDH